MTLALCDMVATTSKFCHSFQAVIYEVHFIGFSIHLF